MSMPHCSQQSAAIIFHIFQHIKPFIKPNKEVSWTRRLSWAGSTLPQSKVPTDLATAKALIQRTGQEFHACYLHHPHSATYRTLTGRHKPTVSLEVWLDQKPVHHHCQAEDGPQTASGQLSSLYQTTTVSGVSTLQRRRWDSTASSSSLSVPDASMHLHQLYKLIRPSTHVVLSGVDLGRNMVPPPSDWEWERVISYITATLWITWITFDCLFFCTRSGPNRHSMRWQPTITNGHPLNGLPSLCQRMLLWKHLDRSSTTANHLVHCFLQVSKHTKAGN